MSKLGVELEMAPNPDMLQRQYTRDLIHPKKPQDMYELRTSCREFISTHIQQYPAIFQSFEQDGFNEELIFHPLKLQQFIENRRKLDSLFKYLRDMGYVDTSTSAHIGMHISIDRNILLRSEFIKLIDTFIEHNELFVQVSGRKGLSQDRVAIKSLVGDPSLALEDYKTNAIVTMRSEMLISSYGRMNHIEALGIVLHDNRIELKWFNSTLHVVYFLARLEFIQLLLVFVTNNEKDFRTFFHKHRSGFTCLKLLNFL